MWKCIKKQLTSTPIKISYIEFVVYTGFLTTCRATITIVLPIICIFTFVVHRFLTIGTHNIIFCKSFMTKDTWFMMGETWVYIAHWIIIYVIIMFISTDPIDRLTNRPSWHDNYTTYIGVTESNKFHIIRGPNTNNQMDWTNGLDWYVHIFFAYHSVCSYIWGEITAFRVAIYYVLHNTCRARAWYVYIYNEISKSVQTLL